MYIGIENKAKMDAARKALGLCNRLRPGKSKAKHNRRILANMRKFRSGKRL